MASSINRFQIIYQSLLDHPELGFEERSDSSTLFIIVQLISISDTRTMH